jgi:hypothetical protein
MITGTVVDGAVVPDAGVKLPEGARMVMALADEADDWDLSSEELESLPPDHPMAPYNREVEIAILKQSIAETQAGDPGRPLREVFEELSRKHGLGPMPPG